MATPLLQLTGLSKYYTSGQGVVMGLQDLNLSFHRGEFVAITGESGSGKSTLAHVLGGILPYEAGEMRFDGRPTSHFDETDYARYRRDQISFISQSYGILPGCTVLENVVSALRLTGMEKPQAQEAARGILEQVQLWPLRRRKAAKLSSGQKQRLSIARALAKPAPILLADEPTGNLDEENSRLVMQLLAQAAGERLVILITHEFSEAAPYATRHLTLRDGRLVMDAALKPPAQPGPMAPRPAPRKDLSLYVARLQLMGRPVWTALMLLLSAVTAFCVFAFLGTFIIASDDTPTRIYDNTAFRNGAQERIVVMRPDGAAFTEEELLELTALDYLTAIEPWGYCADISYAYREGVDYRFENTAQDSGTWDNPELSMTTLPVLTGAAGFVRTVPRLTQPGFLTQGMLPGNIFQAAASDPALLGQTLTVYFQDVKHWGYGWVLPLEVTVVGITDYGQGLYFSAELGRFFTQEAAWDYDQYLFLPADDLLGAQTRAPEYLYRRMLEAGNYVARFPDGTVIPNAPWEESQILTLELILNSPDSGPGDFGYLAPTHSLKLNNLWYVSYEAFTRLLWDGGSNQLSLTIEDYAYTDRVLEQLRQLGYQAISPFREGSTQVDPELAAQRKQTLSVCLAALAAVTALQIIVLRAMFGAQVEIYQLLRNIGLQRRAARGSLAWQLGLLTVVGQALGFAGLGICNALKVERIVHVLRYLPPKYLALLSAVHLLAAVIAGIWILAGITRQVFPLTGKTQDLALEEEEAAV